eukprot:TRINITY_DN1030_c0_g1_i2.p1 TRINITY_DN1030_c0_g1~~TRINITY_DN1030_c0_g1_i2.p1  ORF type:complete len:500 (-),score=113.49 TRINITY_DN1030_c0_g1_i2:277-1704(-)
MGCGASSVGPAVDQASDEQLKDAVAQLSPQDRQRLKNALEGGEERVLAGLPVCVPKILLPRADVDLHKWACVACDQFEAEPEYWQSMAEHAGEAPSTLNLVFPEVYLASVTGAAPETDDVRIAKIGEVMKKYVGDGVFAAREPAFLALDRATACVPSRKGLIMGVDLDQYNYNCPVPTLIRPTERTVPARLPPRIKIRQDAPLELPHIIMIVDDPEKTVIEPLFAGDLSSKEYEAELFKGAGRVTGYKVNEAGEKHVEDALNALAVKEKAAAEAAGREPALILIGDGNHSLATAKACWENLKEKDPSVDKEKHPARFALVELQNLHDDGVVFEPIHRIVKGGNFAGLLPYLEAAWGPSKPVTEAVSTSEIVFVSGSDRCVLTPPSDTLPVVSMTAQVDQFLAENAGTEILFVHGEEPVNANCSDGSAVGLLLPALDKSRFLDTLHKIGTLPRKAFSMGEANEKRFYIEARSLIPQ